jgi:hypothetical protein
LYDSSCALRFEGGPDSINVGMESGYVALETQCTTGVIQGCSIGGNLFNLSINEDLKAIQRQFPQFQTGVLLKKVEWPL